LNTEDGKRRCTFRRIIVSRIIVDNTIRREKNWEGHFMRRNGLIKEG